MLTHESIQNFLYQEASALDDRRWDDWLAFYAPDVEFHMPAWDDDGELTTDPQKEVSLIYYPSRAGLEDRVFRIETERAASLAGISHRRSIGSFRGRRWRHSRIRSRHPGRRLR